MYFLFIIENFFSPIMELKSKQTTFDEKYKKIKFYESKENKKRGTKQKTRIKFDLANISSLCAILCQRDKVMRLYDL